MAPIVALVRFGRWDEVLRHPAPPREWLYTRGVWHYARGIAFNAKGQAAEARRELGELEAILQSVPAGAHVAFFFRRRNMLQLAANVLAGEIAAKAGDTATRRAAAARRRGRAGHALVHRAAAVVLPRAPGAGRRAAAGRARRRGRAGLSRGPEAQSRQRLVAVRAAQSLRAQGKTAEAAQARRASARPGRGPT